MRRDHNRSGRRGFTMVELMVVITILAILLAIVVSATFKMLGLGSDAKNRDNLRQLELTMAQVKTDFGMYPPSRLKVSQYLNQYDASGNITGSWYPQANTPGTLDYYSVKFLTSGKYKRASTQWATAPSGTTPGGIVWSQLQVNGKAWDGKPVILEGDQVLVFALGGIPSTNGGLNVCLGWSNSSTNPADTTNLNKPYFQFQSERLVQRKSDVPFLSYLDAYPDLARLNPATDYKRVFAYFSCYNSQNGYNALINAPKDTTYANAPGPNSSDCWTLNVWPWAQTAGTSSTYNNPDKFQILSPGRDGQWGSGSNPTLTPVPVWTQNNPWTASGPAQDDWSNFSSGTLGSG